LQRSTIIRDWTQKSHQNNNNEEKKLLTKSFHLKANNSIFLKEFLKLFDLKKNLLFTLLLTLSNPFSSLNLKTQITGTFYKVSLLQNSFSEDISIEIEEK
jgi:hypothetical protein